MDFDSLLTRFKFVAGMDVVAGLDSRPGLQAMAPCEFEHLVRQIFEEMGMQAWTTRAIKDDGVDAVAVNTNAVFGGMCIIKDGHAFATRHGRIEGHPRSAQLRGTG